MHAFRRNPMHLFMLHGVKSIQDIRACAYTSVTDICAGRRRALTACFIEQLI